MTVEYLNPKTDYLDLRLVFNALFKNIKLIIVLCLILFSLTMLYSLTKAHRYQASMLLKIQQKDALMGVLPNDNIDPISVQIALIRSEFILNSVIEKLGLNIKVVPEKKSIFQFLKPGQVHVRLLQLPAAYAQQPLILQILTAQRYQLVDAKNNLLLAGKINELSQKNGIKIIVDNINAKPGKRFLIKKTSAIPLINRLLAKLNIIDLTGNNDANTNKTTLLRLTLWDENPQSVTDILNTIADIAQQKNKQLKWQVAEKTLSFLKQQLLQVQTELSDAQIKLNNYRRNSGQIDNQLQTQYLLIHLAEVNQQLEKVRLTKANLLIRYTLHHPAVLALNEEWKELVAKRQELRLKLKTVPAANQPALDLARDVEIKSNLYTDLLKQIQHLQAAKTSIISDIQPLTEAKNPIVLSSNLKILIFSSLLISFLLSLAISLIWNMLLQSYNKPLSETINLQGKINV